MTRGEDRSYRTDVLLLLERCINNLSGTDGRPIICKKPSVTGSHDQPLFLFHLSLFSYCPPLIQEQIFEVASTMFSFFAAA